MSQVTKHDSVGGTGVVVTNDAGKVVFAGTLDAGEPEGLMIACLEEYLTMRRLTDPALVTAALAAYRQQVRQESPPG